MLRRHPLSSYLVLLTTALAAAGLRAADPDHATTAHAVESYLAHNPLAAVTVGIVDSTGDRVFGFGQLERDNSQSRPDGKTIYQIGSISKVFTTTILAEEVVGGRMKLDDPAQNYLPVELVLPREVDRQITLEELATHYSGLPRLPQLSSFFLLGGAIVENPYAGINWQQMPTILRTVWLSEPIGKRYAYSNLGLGLLGQALVTSSQQATYAELVEQRISVPLGLVDTSVSLNDQQSARLAQGYTSLGRMTPAWVFGALEGAGALHSTVDDLLVFAAANLDLRHSKLHTVMQFAQQPRANRRWAGGPMALGWHIKELDTPTSSYVWHNGMTGGYASMLVLVPERRLAVVVLSNVAASVDGIAFEIADKLAQLPVATEGKEHN